MDFVASCCNDFPFIPLGQEAMGGPMAMFEVGQQERCGSKPGRFIRETGWDSRDTNCHYRIYELGPLHQTRERETWSLAAKDWLGVTLIAYQVRRDEMALRTSDIHERINTSWSFLRWCDASNGKSAQFLWKPSCHSAQTMTHWDGSRAWHSFLSSLDPGQVVGKKMEAIMTETLWQKDLQLLYNHIISYHIMSYHIISYIIYIAPSLSLSEGSRLAQSSSFLRVQPCWRDASN